MDYYTRKKQKAAEMQAYVLGILFLIGVIVLGAIFWAAVNP